MRPEYVVHTAQEIIKIRRAAHMTALARDRICSLVHSGMTTKDLDNIAGEVIRSMGGVYVGNEEDMPEDVARLLEYTQKSLEAGLAAAHPGGYVQDISRAVEEVAQQAHLGIVREYVGHGCGIRLHEPPDVPNFAQHRKGPKLVPGMVLCVEPMLNLGSHKVYTESDGWTVRTRDGEPSAHFEHMILITENGTEVLTRV